MIQRRLLQIAAGTVLGLAASLFVIYPVLRERHFLEPNVVELGFLPAPMSVPAFSLTAQDGSPFSLESLRGKAAFVFFGFSSCPDVCPITLHNLTRAFEQVEGAAERIQGILITVDPERDTPERLAEYMSSFDPSFIALTGELDDIRAAADGFGVFFERGPEHAAGQDPGGVDAPGAEDVGGHGSDAHEAHGHDTHGARSPTSGYPVDHTGRTFVLNGEGQVVLTFAPFTTVERMVEALTLFLSSP